MQRRDFLRLTGLVTSSAFGLTPPLFAAQDAPLPNILFITVDDMSCDSVGVFGCKLLGTSPNIDRLASEGIRFTHAHVQVANCVPSRNVMQTGRYPHNSGVEGFYQVKADFPILPDLLKKHGYFTAIKGKVSHSTPFHPHPWDLVLSPDRGRGLDRNQEAFATLTQQAIAAGRKAGKPFYLLMNITDPHKPFYGLGKHGEEIDDPNVPSKTYLPEEVPVPGFLPDLPIVRKELAHYYSSVRRADDCVGAILAALQESGEADNTLVMFLSDHGMPFPFAKTSLYHHSTHTPWIVRWPGTTRPNTADSEHMISAVDFMPTVLEAVGIPNPESLDGHSFLPLLKGETQTGRDMVFKEYNENAGAGRNPMRSVVTRKYGYLFNPWANGTRKFKTATTGTQTYKAMQKLAETDEAMAARVTLFDHRVREEFYDYEDDPDALHNLIDSPACKAEITRLRTALEDWMVRTGDHALEAFRHRDSAEVNEHYMKRLEQEAADRRRDPEQQRGGKGKKSESKGKNAVKIIALSPPNSAAAGALTAVRVPHTIPAHLGEQLVHVTLKDGNGKRIERKVIKAAGKGTLDVTFEVPQNVPGGKISFAAFIGNDYPGRLQHLASAPIPLK